MPRKQAGVFVNEDIALTYSAVWRAVNLISQSISILPWTVNHRRSISEGGFKRVRLFNHPVSNVLDLSVNSEMSSQTFRESIIAHALTWGNGYAEIERDGANRAMAMYLLDPNRVTPDRDSEGRLIYKVKNNGREDTILNARDMYHIKGLGFDGITGYSVIGYASRTVGLGLATEEFGSTFFQNGASFNGVFQHPQALGDDAIKHLRESLTDTHGGVANSNKPLILEEGMTWTATSIPPNDAQFLETRKFTVVEVARWYGIPVHKLMEMDSATFSNIEHQSIEFVNDALMPWIKRLETEADLKLVSPRNVGRIYTKLNVNALLRGDSKARSEWYKTMANLGVYSINEIRALEDENPIDDGDKRLVQLNLTTLEKVGEDIVQPVQPDPFAPDEEPEEETPQQRVLIETIARVQSRERHRAIDALKRYDGDRDGLVKWMDKFYSQHKDYMLENLENPTNAVIENIDVDQFSINHIDVARLIILDAFDNDIGEPVFKSAEIEMAELIGGEL